MSCNCLVSDLTCFFCRSFFRAARVRHVVFRASRVKRFRRQGRRSLPRRRAATARGPSAGPQRQPAGFLSLAEACGRQHLGPGRRGAIQGSHFGSRSFGSRCLVSLCLPPGPRSGSPMADVPLWLGAAAGWLAPGWSALFNAAPAFAFTASLPATCRQSVAHALLPPELGMGLGLRRGRGRAAAGRHFRGPRMAAQGAAGPSVSDLASGGAGLLLRRSGCHGGCGRRLGKLPARRRTGGSHNRTRCGVLFRNAALPTLTASAGRGGGGTDAGRAGAGGSAAAGEAPRGRPSFEPQRGVTAGGAAGLSGPQAAVLRRCGGYLVARGVIVRRCGGREAADGVSFWTSRVRMTCVPEAGCRAGAAKAWRGRPVPAQTWVFRGC